MESGQGTRSRPVFRAWFRARRTVSRIETITLSADTRAFRKQLPEGLENDIVVRHGL